jgi:uncharacterized protein YndB with AHSA1/START domain
MNLVLRRVVEINATPAKVWTTITDPKITKHWAMGLEVSSEWKAGSPIIWKGMSDGKVIIHKGQVLDIELKRLLQISDFGLEMGLEDKETNYTRITYELSPKSERTVLTVTEDRFNGNKERYKDAESFWDKVLLWIKAIAEQDTESSIKQ